jgi:dipeptidyl aminopeptidase/acylaminoacyl peptidase
MSRSASALLLALVLLTARASAQHGFTLEQVLSAPFPEMLTPAPTGGAVAWVLNDAGVRNVWVAAPPAYQPRAVSTFKGDEGLEIYDLGWAPNGRSLVFTRGTPANGAGEYPNPAGVAAGATRELWWTPTDSTPKKLGDGGAGAVSPKDGRVAFVKSGDIWWQQPGDTAKAELLVNTRGADALRWSPDGTHLAFVSRRDDHSFVGVLDLGTRRVTYLDAGFDNDTDPAWSPDGRSVAFLRLPAASDELPFVPQRTGAPWSVRVVDAGTGVGRVVWRADSGRGSVFREVTAPNQLLWGAGDRLVFPWERDGWTHLYSVPAAGGPAVLLTPGDFEVEDVALTGDRAAVVYSSNQADIDRRHLWRVPVRGGTPAALTHGNTIEWSPTPASGGKSVVFLRADARRPPRVALLAAGAEARDLPNSPVPAGFPAGQLVEPTQVVFPAADGLAIHGQLFLPDDLKRGERRPAVIFFHGGSRRQMLLGWHYMYYYRNAYAMNQYLANQGFIVLAVNYRSGIGYGLDFREALAYGAAGASEYQDVTGAALYLRGRSDVIPDRIGLWGGSYGGYLTALGLARASNLFRAGVDLHGVHDWNSEIPTFAPNYQPALRPEFAKRAFESSPLASVDTWRSPVLLIHGDDDRNVPFSESVRLLQALRARGVETETLVFPDEVHDFLTHAHWIQAYRAATEFLGRHLRPTTPQANAPR